MTSDKTFKNFRVFDIAGHRDKVYTLGWNCTGERLATGSWDGTVRVCQVDSAGKTRGSDELASFRDTSHYCEQLAWHSTKETVLATAVSDKMLRTWDTRSRRLASRYRLTGVGQTLAWHPSGNLLAVGSSNEALAIFDIRGGELNKPLHVIEKIVESASDMEFTPDGAYLVLGGSSVLHLFQTDPWGACGRLPAHNGSVWAVAMDPKGPYMATGAGDGLTCLWDRESLVCVRVFGAKDTPNMSVAFSHDGQYLAIASNEDHVVEVCNTTDGTVAHQLSSPKPVDSVKWNPKHLMLAFTGDYSRDRDGLTSLWLAA